MSRTGKTPVYNHVSYQQNQAKIYPRSGKSPKVFALSVILDLTPGFNGTSKENCKTGWETFKFGDLVHLILKVWRYVHLTTKKHWLTSSNIGLFTTSCKGSSRLRQRVKNLLYCPSANFLFTDIRFFNRSCCNKKKFKFKQQTSQTTTYTHWPPLRYTISSLIPRGKWSYF